NDAVLDGNDAVPEFSREFNNFGSASFEVVLTPPPDLQVAAVTAPANLLTSQRGTVTWIVPNFGTGPTVDGAWTDRVFLSRDTNLDPSSDVLLGQLRHSGTLAVEGSYSGSLQFEVPRNITGQYFVLVETDSFNEVFEHTAEHNNVGASASPITISVPPPADLVIDS